MCALHQLAQPARIPHVHPYTQEPTVCAAHAHTHMPMSTELLTPLCVCVLYVCGIPLQEFEELEEGSDVYKLVGPILVKQSVDEAKVDVERRLEFINSEM